MSLKPFLKIPEYVDEILDTLRYTFHAINAHFREEMPFSEIFSYVFGVMALVLIASLFRRYINRKK